MGHEVGQRAGARLVGGELEQPQEVGVARMAKLPGAKQPETLADAVQRRREPDVGLRLRLGDALEAAADQQGRQHDGDDAGDADIGLGRPAQRETRRERRQRQRAAPAGQRLRRVAFHGEHRLAERGERGGRSHVGGNGRGDADKGHGAGRERGQGARPYGPAFRQVEFRQRGGQGNGVEQQRQQEDAGGGVRAPAKPADKQRRGHAESAGQIEEQALGPRALPLRRGAACLRHLRRPPRRRTRHNAF